MKPKYREEPHVWRKSTLLSVLAVALLSVVLRWRHILARGTWLGILAALGCVAILAWFHPRYFRGYYRFSTWAGFWSSQCVARFLLGILFIAVIVPARAVLRLLGKDALHLRRSKNIDTYWRPVKPLGPLDRLF